MQKSRRNTRFFTILLLLGLGALACRLTSRTPDAERELQEPFARRRAHSTFGQVTVRSTEKIGGIVGGKVARDTLIRLRLPDNHEPNKSRHPLV